MDKAEFAKVFPFGTHLCREPMPPMSQLRADMERVKRHGFNLIKLQEHWGVDEPLEGVRDFSAYHELIEYAANLDMGIYLGLTCEQAPAWLFQKYPGCRMVGRDGVPVAYEAQGTLPADGKPGPCGDHPEAFDAQIGFIQHLVRELGEHENIVVWNTWQEIGYGAKRLVGTDVCYCEHTLAFFREWLAAEHGDVDNLNAAWKTKYRDWSHVQPYRALREYCLPQSVAWRFFMDNVQVTRVLERRADAIREVDFLNRPVFAHKSAPTVGSGMDWSHARAQDFLGSSAYPSWSPFHAWDDGAPASGGEPTRNDTLAAEMHTLALRFDYLRSCNEAGSPVWAAEFQGGRVSNGFVLGRAPGAEDIRRWMLTAVASGVTAISFWVTRAEIAGGEAYGFGLLDNTGESTSRLEEAGRIGRALGQYPGLFADPRSMQQAEVAILVDESNYQTQQTLNHAGGHLGYSTRGWHRLLWELDIAVDFVASSQLQRDSIPNYTALIAPFPLCLAETTAAAMRDYVSGGGNLVVEAGPGRLDENTFTRRGEISPTIAQLCGVEHESLTQIAEPEGERRWSAPPFGWGQYATAGWLEGCSAFAGHRLRANVYLQTLTPRDADPIAQHGSDVAATGHAYGKGTAYLFGTLIGHNGSAFRDADSAAFVRKLLEQCGATPGRQLPALVRRRQTSGRQAWILTNPTEQATTANLDLSWSHNVECLLSGEALACGEQVEVNVPAHDVRVLIVEET